MLERLIILLIAMAIVSVGWMALRWVLAWHMATVAQQPPASSLGALFDKSLANRPALLYFSTDDCAQCRFQQKPILDRLAEATALPILHVNAVESQDLARHYGILTVPSTVLLDSRRKAVAINHGLAPIDKLHRQIGALESGTTP